MIFVPEPPFLVRPAGAVETRYRLKGNFEGDGPAWNCDAVWTESPAVTNAEGTITFVRTPVSTSILFGGDTREVLGGPAATLVIAPDGELKEHRTDPAARAAARAAALRIVVPPPGEIAVEGTWTKERPAIGDLPPVVRTFRYLGSEDRVGVPSHKLRLEAKESIGFAPASLEATVWIRKDDGTVQSIDGRWTRMPVGEEAAPLNGPFTIERIG